MSGGSGFLGADCGIQGEAPPALSQALSVFAANDMMSYQTAVAGNMNMSRGGGGGGGVAIGMFSEVAAGMALPQLTAFVDNATRYKLGGAGTTSSADFDGDFRGMSDLKSTAVGGGIFRSSPADSSVSPTYASYIHHRDQLLHQQQQQCVTNHRQQLQLFDDSPPSSRFDGSMHRHRASPYATVYHDHGSSYTADNGIPSSPEPAQCGDLPLDLTAKTATVINCRPDEYFGRGCDDDAENYPAATVDEMEIDDVEEFIMRRRREQERELMVVPRNSGNWNEMEDDAEDGEPEEVYKPRRNYRNWSRAQAAAMVASSAAVGSPSTVNNTSPTVAERDDCRRDVVGQLQYNGELRPTAVATPVSGHESPTKVARPSSSSSSYGRREDRRVDINVSETDRRKIRDAVESPDVAVAPELHNGWPASSAVVNRRSSNGSAGSSDAGGSTSNHIDRQSPAGSNSSGGGSWTASAVSGRYTCSHCEIDFHGSRVLHAMHMAYHGADDPFQCGSCGAKTADRVAFFLHLARVAHN
jgi:hypothetical protein